MMSIHYSNTNTRTNVRGRTESPRARHTTLGTYETIYTPNGNNNGNTSHLTNKAHLLNRRTPSQQKQYADQLLNDEYDTYEEDSYIKLNNRARISNQIVAPNPLPYSVNTPGVKRNLTGQQGGGGVQLQSLNGHNANNNYIYNSSLMQPSSHGKSIFPQQPLKQSTSTQRPRVSDFSYNYLSSNNNASKLGTTSTVGVPKYANSIVTTTTSSNILGSNLHSNSGDLLQGSNLESKFTGLNLNEQRQTYLDSQLGANSYANSKNFRPRKSQFSLYDSPTMTTTTSNNKPAMTTPHVLSGYPYASQSISHQQHLQSNTSSYSNAKNPNSEGPAQFYASQYQAPYKPGNNLLPSPSSTSSSSSSSPPLQLSSNTTTNYGYTSGATQFYVSNPNSSHQVYGNDLDSRGVVGLKNLGNTCFMNSILQCLSNTRCLLEYCLSGSYNNDINTTMSVMKGALFNSYASLIKKMWKNEDIISPKEFKDQIARFAPRFVGYAQQDAEEFLYYLLKGLHEDVNLIRKKPTPVKFDEKAWDRMNDLEKSQKHWSMNLETDNSRISDMFVGQLKSTLKCTECNYKSPTFELFWHLAVPIPKKSQIDLHDCLSQFMLEEVLKGDNMPFCSRCKEKRCCTKRYTIEKLPKILVIHLKRFLKVRFNNKINLNVDYPIEGLDMSRYLSQNVDSSSRMGTTSNCLYDLYGISLHSGTESSGHYVAYAKHPYNHKWNCFNDSIVREIPYSALQDANAYILFYQLRS